jgi:cytochrome P450
MAEIARTTHPVGWSPETQWAAVQRGEPHSIVDIYQAQRERCPVAWRAFDDGQGFWSVFDFDDVAQVLENPALFSSARPKYGLTLIPIEVDPPDHRKYRVLLAQIINAARLARLETAIRAYVREQLALVRAKESDLLAATSATPIRAFCLMVGDPDPEAFRELHLRREAANDPRLARFDDASVKQRADANKPLVDYCAGLIERHRREPQDDIVSDILAGEIDGRPISHDEALSMLSLLYIAGSRTTTAALRGAVVQLARAPELQARLRAQPSLIPAAAEEIVRLETPVHGLPRYATADTEIGGCPIAKGEQVFPNYGAANLDPKAFPHPGEIDLERKPIRHVGFGRGVHVCAGAPLARLQLRVFIEELLGAFASLRLAGPVTRMTWPHYGATALPVEVVAGPLA